MFASFLPSPQREKSFAVEGGAGWRRLAQPEWHCAFFLHRKMKRPRESYLSGPNFHVETGKNIRELKIGALS
jgi:hypothetical protein